MPRTKDEMAKRHGFGRLRKLPSGYWQAGYTGPDGSAHYAPETFGASIDAEAWLHAEHRLIEGDDWQPPAERRARKYSRGVTFADFAEPWLEGRELKPRTATHYRKLLDTRLLPAFGDVQLKAISPDRVKSWHNEQGDGTPTYTAHAYSLLRTILTSAVTTELIPTSPCQIPSAGRSKRVKHIEPASISELTAIVAEMPEQHRLAVELAAWCALRFGEIAELRRHDIDLKNGRIHVSRGVVMIDGERIVGTPKTDAGDRRISIPPHLLPVMRDHIETHAQPGRNGLLFYGKDGTQLASSTLNGKPARRRRIKGRMVNESATGFCRAREAAGRPDLRFHDLRHTGAVLAAQAGATLPDLMLRLGHTTPAAAMIYQHAAKDRDKEIAARMSAMAGEPQ